MACQAQNICRRDERDRIGYLAANAEQGERGMRTIAIATACAALGVTALLAGCNQAVEKPAMTVQQLMAKEVQPNAEVYWNAVQYIADEKGNHDIFPKNDAEWETVRMAAVKMGEHGKLLQTPGYTEGRGEDWTEFSKGLVEVAAVAEAAAKEKSTEKVFEVGGTVYNVCSACHQAYPAEQGVPATPSSTPA